MRVAQAARRARRRAGPGHERRLGHARSRGHRRARRRGHRPRCGRPADLDIDHERKDERGSSPMSTMTAVQFDYLRDLVRKESAIVLEPGKEYLVESRLAPIARREGMESVGELVQRLVTSPAHPLRNV